MKVLNSSVISSHSVTANLVIEIQFSSINTSFTNGKLKFDGQASAVALEKGASVDMAYKDGVAVYTKAIGGLMFEASLGGQHFKFKPKKK